MGFRDDDIQHAFDDAVKFFNETFALDSPPNEQHEYLFQDESVLFSQRCPLAGVEQQTGNTHTTCREIHDGGFQVTFS